MPPRARASRAGQAGHFLNAAPVKDVYAARRYIDESKRLLQVYEGQLAGGGGEGRDYLVGEGRGKFSYVRDPSLLRLSG